MQDIYKAAIQNSIEEYIKNNPEEGIEILAQLVIGNTNIVTTHSDENLQKIKDLLNETKPKYKHIIETALLEKIAEKNSSLSESNYFPSVLASTSSVPQLLAWFYKQRNYDIELTDHENLSNLNPEQLKALSVGLKIMTIPTLNLSRNNLGKLSPEKFEIFCNGVKAIKSPMLKLNGNKLNRLSPDQWTSLFAAIKDSGIKSLDLNVNNLDRLNLEQGAAFCSGLIEAKLTSLNLSGNNLNNLSTEKWIAFFASIKDSGITSLNLSGNNLNGLNSTKWTIFCSGIKKAEIISLDLTWNDLNKLNLEQWSTFCDALSLSRLTKLNIIEKNELVEDRAQQLQRIIDKNNRKILGLGEEGLKNLCTLHFWQQAGAKLNKNDTKSEFTSDTSAKIELNDLTYNLLDQARKRFQNRLS